MHFLELTYRNKKNQASVSILLHIFHGMGQLTINLSEKNEIKNQRTIETFQLYHLFNRCVTFNQSYQHFIFLSIGKTFPLFLDIHKAKLDIMYRC